jgi:hypothetical protein
MKTCVFAAALFLFVTISAHCRAAEFLHVPPHCAMLQATAVAELQQRIEIAEGGFFILYPQGERWCYCHLKSNGVSFFGIPPLAGFEKPPSLEEIIATRLFSGMAMSLKGFKDLKSQITNPDELKAVVNLLIREQLIPANCRARHHESPLSLVGIERFERGIVWRDVCEIRCEGRRARQSPGAQSRFRAQFPGNVVCRHPHVSDTELIWVGFTERYLRSEQPGADSLKQEYELYLQSLQFTAP